MKKEGRAQGRPRNWKTSKYSKYMKKALTKELAIIEFKEIRHAYSFFQSLGGTIVRNGLPLAMEIVNRNVYIYHNSFNLVFEPTLIKKKEVNEDGLN